MERPALTGLWQCRLATRQTTWVETMNISIWITAVLLAGVVGINRPCVAAENSLPQLSERVLLALAETSVSAAELGEERARGFAVNVNGSALSNGNSVYNHIVSSPITGLIENEHSINNNVGITSVLQNFGNNAVVQTSTTINITVY